MKYSIYKTKLGKILKLLFNILNTAFSVLKEIFFIMKIKASELKCKKDLQLILKQSIS